MKKALLLVVTIILFIGGLPVIGSALTPSNTDGDLAQQWDRFNLLIPKEPIYLKTADRYGQIQSHGDYLYTQQAYRANGTHYQITFQAPQKLRANHYLKLEAKGRFVSSWSAVNHADLPDKIKSVIK